MNIRNLGHVAFICQDLERSCRFYRDALGLRHKFSISYGDLLDNLLAEAQQSGTAPNAELVARLEPIREKIWISYFEIGTGAFVELFDAGQATLPCIPDRDHFNYDHVSLVVDDIFAAHRALIERGIPIDTPPRLGLEHTWQMWTHDPDGNKLEFMQYTDRSWQLTGR